jgi:hypothetical protein
MKWTAHKIWNLLLGEKDDPYVQPYVEALQILTASDSVWVQQDFEQATEKFLQQVSSPRVWLTVTRLLMDSGTSIRLPERFVHS